MPHRRRAGTQTAEPALVELAPPVRLRRILAIFWPYARPYRRWLWLTLAVTVIGPAIDGGVLWLFKLLVDDVLVPRNVGALLPIALLYLGLTVASGVVSYIDQLASTWVAERFLTDVRTAVFDHFTKLPPRFFDERPSGDLVDRLSGDVSAVETLLISGVSGLLSNILRLVFFSAALIYLRWDLALIGLAVAPLFWLIAAWFSRRTKAASRERRRRSGSVSAVAQEALSSMTLLQAYQREEAAVHRFHAQALARMAAQMASTRVRALVGPIVDVVELMGSMVVLGVGSWELASGRISLGGLLVFVAYLSQMYSPVRGLARMAGTFQSATASAERLIEVLDEKPAVTESAGAPPLQHVRGRVEFDAVWYHYPKASGAALRDVSIAVEPGEVVALVGRSGAGKSTLARLLLRFDDPARGAVRIDGHDLRDVDLGSLRRSIAIVLQETLIVSGTVRENIAMGRPEATEVEIRRAAEAADAAGFIRALPDGYDTVLGQQGRRLSGGQRQRIAIARALVRDAPIVILDEPSTGLDAESTEKVMDPIRTLMRGRTVVIISHNLRTVREANRIVVLDRGRVVDEGRHDDLMARGGLYASLYAAHRLREDDGGPRLRGMPGTPVLTRERLIRDGMGGLVREAINDVLVRGRR